MTLVFWHLPKTGGSSIHELIMSLCNQYSLKTITISQENVNRYKANDLLRFSYIRFHAVSGQYHNLFNYIANKPSDFDQFSIIRYPIDHIQSFWRHSLQISSQIVPRDHTIPAFHNLYKSLDQYILYCTTNQIDLQNYEPNLYSGIARMFWGQQNELIWLTNSAHKLHTISLFPLESLNKVNSKFYDFVNNSLRLNCLNESFNSNTSFIPHINSTRKSLLDEHSIKYQLFLHSYYRNDIKIWLKLVRNS